MLRFSLGRIPVGVHFTHFLLPLMLAFSWKPTDPSTGWPATVFSDSGHPATSQTMVLFVAMWVALVFVSVLVHELGHAVVALVYGYKPTIELEWMGGHTNPNTEEKIPWHRDVLLTFAGPTFGVLLGMAALAGAMVAANGTPQDYFFKRLAETNFFWSVFNLIPMLPMDGGRIASAVLQRVFGRRGFLMAQVLALVLVVIGLFLAVTVLQAPLMTVIFAMWGMRAWTLIQAYRRGEVPEREAPSPGDLSFAKAAEDLQQGRLDEAQAGAEGILGGGSPSKAERSRAHHVLGWVSLKRGDGARALSHFGLVDGEVERPALAAAYSLSGQDEQALPLWELAYRERPDPTVLHEWAGTLIRLGREGEARALPGLTLAAAYQCAERVSFLRGEFARAGEFGEKANAERASGNTAYDAACAYARAGMREDALRMLRAAKTNGFSDWSHAATDPDLSALRGHPEFEVLKSGRTT